MPNPWLTRDVCHVSDVYFVGLSGVLCSSSGAKRAFTAATAEPLPRFMPNRLKEYDNQNGSYKQ